MKSQFVNAYWLENLKVLVDAETPQEAIKEAIKVIKTPQTHLWHQVVSDSYFAESVELTNGEIILRQDVSPQTAIDWIEKINSATIAGEKAPDSAWQSCGDLAVGLLIEGATAYATETNMSIKDAILWMAMSAIYRLEN